MHEFDKEKSLQEMFDEIMSRLDLSVKFTSEDEDRKAEKASVSVHVAEYDIAMKYAEEELAELHSAWIDFQNRIKDLVVTDIVLDGIAVLSDMFAFLEQVLHGDFEMSEDSRKARESYRNLQELRAGLLMMIYNHYMDEE